MSVKLPKARAENLLEAQGATLEVVRMEGRPKSYWLFVKEGKDRGVWQLTKAVGEALVEENKLVKVEDLEDRDFYRWRRILPR